MTLNLEDLYVTSFETGPAGADELMAVATANGCIRITAAYSNCDAFTCITCAVGCESGGGAYC